MTVHYEVRVLRAQESTDKSRAVPAYWLVATNDSTGMPSWIGRFVTAGDAQAVADILCYVGSLVPNGTDLVHLLDKFADRLSDLLLATSNAVTEAHDLVSASIPAVPTSEGGYL